MLTSTVGDANPLRYRGYYYDTETSLYYLQSRYYDPETGRFISADTLLVAGSDLIQGVNLFAYCYNNPIMYSDPSGYEAENGSAVLIILGEVILSAALIATLLPIDDAIYFAESLVDAGLDIDEIFYYSGLLLDGMDADDILFTEHRKRGTTNPANLEKHQKGITRKNRDAGNEKGDARRKEDRSNKRNKNSSTNKTIADVATVGIIIVSTIVILDDVTGIGTVDDILLVPLIGLL